MKKITLLNYFALFFLTVNSYSQSVSVELSIEWKKEENVLNIFPLLERKVIFIPYLSVIYRNFSDHAIYFHDVITTNDVYPIVAYIGPLTYPSVDRVGMLARHDNYSKGRYNVYLGVSKHYKTSWLISDTSRLGESSIVQDEIANCYSVLQTQSLLDKFKTKKKLSCFSRLGSQNISYKKAQALIDSIQQKDLIKFDFEEGEVTEKNILTTFANQFIFLEKDQVIHKQINLIGFLIMGGGYNFSIFDATSQNFVLGSKYFDKDKSKWNYKKIMLPKNVAHYQLFEGVFLTNSVMLKINH